MKKKIGDLIFAVLLVVGLTAISWIITCGIIKLITLCFGLKFSFQIATGIWLLFVLFNWMRGSSKKER